MKVVLDICLALFMLSAAAMFIMIGIGIMRVR